MRKTESIPVIFPDEFDRYKKYDLCVDPTYKKGLFMDFKPFDFCWNSEHDRDRLVKKAIRNKPGYNIKQIEIKILKEYD